MSSYTPKELNTLSYIVSFFESSDYKFLASLLKKEYGLHSESAYVSRMYILKKSGIRWMEKLEKYNILNVKNSMLKAVLKPENMVERSSNLVNTTCNLTIEPQRSINIDPVCPVHSELVDEKYYANLNAEFNHYKVKTRDNIKRMNKILQQRNDKVKELELELQKQEQAAATIVKKLKLLKTQIETRVRNEVVRDDGEVKREEPVDENLTTYFDQMKKIMVPRTIEEWKKNPLKTNPSHPVYVKSDKDKSNKYKVRYFKDTKSYHCECLAWKYQKLNPHLRSCKHINAVFGERPRIL